MTRVVLSVLCIVTIATSVACSSPRANGSLPAAQGQTSTSTLGIDAPAPDTPDPAAPTQRSSPTQPPTSPPTTSPAVAANGTPPPGKLPLALSVAPKCTTPGGQMTATVQTAHDVRVAIFLQYPGTGFEDPQFGNADSSGQFVLTWSTPVTATTGSARVLAAANDGNATSDMQEAPFEVALRC